MNGYENTDNNDTSSFITDPLSGISKQFTEISTIQVSDRNIVSRAKRYGRWWILKGLNPEFSESMGLAALRKEFEIMSSLHHQLIADVYSIEEVPGLGVCLVMEYAGSHNLAQWLATEPTVSARSKVARQLLNAVEYLHSHGVVHRDIKPSNIMIDDLDDNVQMIDFGLADTLSHAVFKSPAGTKGYMSPEQEHSDRPDPANDMFSLGKVLETLRAGSKWNFAARVCTRSKERRPHNVAALREYLNVWHWGWVALWILLGVGALILILAVSISVLRTGGEPVQQETTAAPPIEQPAAPEPDTSTPAPQGSVPVTAPDNPAPESPAVPTATTTPAATDGETDAARQKEKDKIVAEGKKLVDKNFREADRRPVNPKTGLPPFSPPDEWKKVQAYIDSYKGRFSDYELSTITTIVGTYHKERYEEWANKYIQEWNRKHTPDNNL